jgi:hypothetical protein
MIKRSNPFQSAEGAPQRPIKNEESITNYASRWLAGRWPELRITNLPAADAPDGYLGLWRPKEAKPGASGQRIANGQELRIGN